MGKRKIVITREQLKKLNEVDLSVQAPQNTGAAYSSAINAADTRNQLRTLTQNSGEDSAAVVSGPNSKESSGVVNIEVPRGKNPSDIIAQDPGLGKAIEGGARARFTGTGFPMEESKKFTKKQLEEARLNNIRKNGRVTTKAKLFENTGKTGPLNYQEVEELKQFCQTADYFEFFHDTLRGRINHNLINTCESLRQEILLDIVNAKRLEYTDEIDYYVELQVGRKIDMQTSDVVKVFAPAGEVYYIVWERV